MLGLSEATIMGGGNHDDVISPHESIETCVDGGNS
jgi:hypothetical protein